MPTFLIEEALKGAQYKKREAPWQHTPYDYELSLLNMIKSGDVQGLRDLFLENHFNPRNHLSRNVLHQRRYELIASVTLITRWAVEGGLDVETAYDLADAYILSADETNDIHIITALMREAPLHFATLVHEQKRKHRLPKPVLQCMEYIESNLHNSIGMDDLAAYTGKNASYLSTLFKKETEKTITEYILQKKLDEARTLLADTDSPIAQIASTLAFSTQSYFSTVFVRRFGETPRRYRRNHFRLHQQ